MTQAYGTGNRVGVVVQTILKAYEAITPSAKLSQEATLGNIVTTILSYVLNNQTNALLSVLE